MNHEELWRAFVEPDEASFVDSCDGCGFADYDVAECEHDRALCPDCVAEGKCRDCATLGMTRGWTL